MKPQHTSMICFKESSNWKRKCKSSNAALLSYCTLILSIGHRKERYFGESQGRERNIEGLLQKNISLTKELAFWQKKREEDVAELKETLSKTRIAKNKRIIYLTYVSVVFISPTSQR